MRIGINGSNLIAVGAPVSAMAEHAAKAEADGFDTYWLAQLAVPDALTAIPVLGAATSTITFGTAVIPTWPRHPLMLAAQALTCQELVGNRLILGIGLAHKMSIEGSLRIPFDTPAKHMEEYLDVLLPAMEERSVDATGDIWSAFAPQIGAQPTTEAPITMLAAMGPRMLDLAGARTSGSILWLSGPKTVDEWIRPKMEAAAEAAGRPAPRVVASVPVCVTDDPDKVRAAVAAVLAGYNELPSYRGVMDREGVDGPAGVSLIGNEDEVSAGLEAFAAAGTTDFSALEFTNNPDDEARTRALLAKAAAES